jgi:hypothetical protein
MALLPAAVAIRSRVALLMQRRPAGRGRERGTVKTGRAGRAGREDTADRARTPGMEETQGMADTEVSTWYDLSRRVCLQRDLTHYLTTVKRI